MGCVLVPTTWYTTLRASLHCDVLWCILLVPCSALVACSGGDSECCGGDIECGGGDVECLVGTESVELGL